MIFKETVLKNYSAGHIQGFGGPDLACGPDFAPPPPGLELVRERFGANLIKLLGAYLGA